MHQQTGDDIENDQKPFLFFCIPVPKNTEMDKTVEHNIPP